MKRNYSQLSLDERRTIYKLLEAGQSKTRIASHLEESEQTVTGRARKDHRAPKDALLTYSLFSNVFRLSSKPVQY